MPEQKCEKQKKSRLKYVSIKCEKHKQGFAVLRTPKFRWAKAPSAPSVPPLLAGPLMYVFSGKTEGLANGGCGLGGSLARKEIKARASSCYVPLYNDYFYTYTTSKIVHKFRYEQTKKLWFQKNMIQNYSEQRQSEPKSVFCCQILFPLQLVQYVVI